MSDILENIPFPAPSGAKSGFRMLFKMLCSNRNWGRAIQHAGRLLLFTFIFIHPSNAFAACTNPIGVEAEQIYNRDYKVMQYCDGTTWWSMKPGGASILGGLSDTNIPSPADNDILSYDSATGKWVAGTPGIGVETDPEVNTLTGSKWCASNAGGTAIDCTQNAPVGDNLGAGGTTAGSLFSTNGTATVGRDSTDFIRFDNNSTAYWQINGVWEYQINPTHFSPYANNVNDLGNSSQRWKNGWFAGNVTATAYFHSSDLRLKDKIEDIDNPFDLLNAIHGKHYVWKKDGVGAYGIIAQDVEKVMPDAVRTDSETGMKSVDYDQLIAPMIEAIKQLKSENASLSARIKQLEEK